MPRRIFVRINGCADGGVAVSIGDNATKEEFLTKATSKLLRGQPDHVDASGALIYFEGGQYEADMEDLEANDKVVVALTGSPYKDKLSRPDEPGESHDVDPSATAGQPGPPVLPPSLPVPHPGTGGPVGIGAGMAAEANAGAANELSSEDEDFNFNVVTDGPTTAQVCGLCRSGWHTLSLRPI